MAIYETTTQLFYLRIKVEIKKRGFSRSVSFLAIAWTLAGSATKNAEAVMFCNHEYMPPGTCVPYAHMLERQKQSEQLMYEQRTAIYSPKQWDEFIKAAHESDKRNAEGAEQKRMRDPVYRDLKNGAWEFHQSKPNDPVQACQATFLSLRGGVLFIDMKGRAKGTFIGFFGAGVPKPDKPDQVAVSLTQSGETQTVQAYPLYLPWDGSFGAIIMAIPSTKALIDSIEENQDYAVAVNGKTISSG